MYVGGKPSNIKHDGMLSTEPGKQCTVTVKKDDLAAYYREVSAALKRVLVIPERAVRTVCVLCFSSHG